MFLSKHCTKITFKAFSSFAAKNLVLFSQLTGSPFIKAVKMLCPSNTNCVGKTHSLEHVPGFSENSILLTLVKTKQTYKKGNSTKITLLKCHLRI